MLRLICFDVDGVLTDGRLYYGPEGEQFKAFDARDGIAFHWLANAQIPVALISGHDSAALRTRARDLRVDTVRAPEHDKELALCQIASKYKVQVNDVAMVGDDLQDLRAMHLAGWSACPVDAVAAVRAEADYISPYRGGHGAARDIIEVALRRAGLLAAAHETYCRGI